jgi:hypothetical protein
MRKAAVNINTSGETIPKARKESKTGNANPSMFGMLRVAQ